VIILSTLPGCEQSDYVLLKTDKMFTLLLKQIKLCVCVCVCRLLHVVYVHPVNLVDMRAIGEIT